MTALGDWAKLVRGEGCPLCRPRAHSAAGMLEIVTLSTSTLYLSRNQAYRGHCALVFDPRHETRVEALSREEYDGWMDDFRRAVGAIVGAVQPDHMNYASLGNEVPHLHWHLIPRYEGQTRWRQPVWTTRREEMADVKLPDADYDALVEAIGKRLR